MYTCEHPKVSCDWARSLYSFIVLSSSLLEEMPWLFFWVCFASTQLALQVQQERSQVVCGNKKSQKRLTNSNSTPAMNFGLGTNLVSSYCGMGV